MQSDLAALQFMPLLITTPLPLVESTRCDSTEVLSELVAQLRCWFDVEFSLWDSQGKLLLASQQQPSGDRELRSELVRSAGQHSEAQFIADEDSVLLLAIPLSEAKQRSLAVAAFAIRRVDDRENISSTAQLLGLDADEARRWINGQSVWTADSLLRLASAITDKMAAEAKAETLQQEVNDLSQNLSSSYEEISLLYALTKNLRISSSDEQLGKLALDWLSECVDAQAISLLLLPVEDEGVATYDARTSPTLLQVGDSPIDAAQLNRLIDTLQLDGQSGPVVANRQVTSANDWLFPDIRQLIVVPLCEGDNLFGWLAAFNHTGDREFGTVEASLLSSVGSLLGIHSGNRELYRQQSEFMANVVRALTSAIDAKDPYTCGHSDRVARISVRLAQQLGCDEKTLDTLYMGGLLHDIGKIGVQDSVLQKPGRLTNAEFEQIKMHPTLGHKILIGLKQFNKVLPIVLHHHEEWDGSGYPHGLRGEEIPYLARIAAVADAYDAMTSDRPYRKGMPLEKVEAIFRQGSGSQWDAKVLVAYFAAAAEIQEISQLQRANLTVNVQKWV